jgi:hypothetical protein
MTLLSAAHPASPLTGTSSISDWWKAGPWIGGTISRGSRPWSWLMLVVCNACGRATDGVLEVRTERRDLCEAGQLTMRHQPGSEGALSCAH